MKFVFEKDGEKRFHETDDANIFSKLKEMGFVEFEEETKEEIIIKLEANGIEFDKRLGIEKLKALLEE